MSGYTKLVESVVKWVGKIQWKQKKYIPATDLDTIKGLLVKDYYVILTRRHNHLSSFFIGLSHWLQTGVWGYYTHILANLENEVGDVGDFRLVEAIGTGVQLSPFHTVFDCDSVVLLKPKGVTLEQWTEAMDEFKNSIGFPYDTLFDIKDRSRVSCVELIYAGMLKIPDYQYADEFARVIRDAKPLTPQMFLESGLFEVVFKSESF